MILTAFGYWPIPAVREFVDTPRRLTHLSLIPTDTNHPAFRPARRKGLGLNPTGRSPAYGVTFPTNGTLYPGVEQDGLRFHFTQTLLT